MRRTRAAGGELLEPELILPAQFTVVRGRPDSGCRALMLAVLELAVRDYQLWLCPKPRHSYEHWRTRQALADLIEWFRSDRTDGPFTFVSLCETFGLDPEAVRGRLYRVDWKPAGSLTHMHATAQIARQLHGGYRAAR